MLMSAVFLIVTSVLYVTQPSMLLASASAQGNTVDNNNNDNYSRQMSSPGAVTKPPINTNTVSVPLTAAAYDRIKGCSSDQHTPTNPVTYLTHFSCGHVNILSNGTVLRKFLLHIQENVPVTVTPDNPSVGVNAWVFNGTIPGPTMRVTQGDHVQITVWNDPAAKHAHSLHMHSIHSGDMDGMMGPAGNIPPGGKYTYNFVAQPYGIYPYHCHMQPVESHINHGLYGMIIIDPSKPRPQAKEMVMMLNGYNLVDFKKEMDPVAPPTVAQLQKNFSDATQQDQGDNQIYSVNGVAFYYRDNPIHLVTGQKYRIYLANMVEFDPENSFHMHGNMFYYVPSGSQLKPSMYNDILLLGQGDRGVIEFNYTFPGVFMFHAHINRITDRGWLGFFDVTRPREMGTMSSMGKDIESLVFPTAPEPVTTSPTPTSLIIGQQVSSPKTEAALTTTKENNNTTASSSSSSSSSPFPFLQ